MRGINSHKGRPLLLIILAMVVLLAGTANAGLFDKKPEKTKGLLKNHRFNRYPALSFTRGELQQGMHGEWLLGDRALRLAEGCVIVGVDGALSELAAGRSAIVSGTVIGGMIFASEIRLLKPAWNVSPSLESEGEKETSDSNSDVGVLKNAPM